MARSLRIQYPGALYSVSDRGNYRSPIFDTVGAARAFLDTLEETVSRFDWRLFAYCLMSNHFHLSFETVKPNLVGGMHWLLTTYAIRYNRFRKEQGHLFQGRYHAGLIQDYRQLGHVVDYIHLNPVQAKIVDGAHPHTYRWSSLGPFLSDQRPSILVAQDWLATHGFADSKDGWVSYLLHIKELASSLELQKANGGESFTRGRAIGSQEWKRALARRFDRRDLSEGIDPFEIQAIKEAEWEHALALCLAAKGKTERDCELDRKQADWKLRIAMEIRNTQAASVAWLARRLYLGPSSSARSALSRFFRIQQNSI